MADEFDPFQQDTGFKDDYDGEVIDAWFGKTERGPDTLLFLKVRADDGEEVENRYGCGSDWVTFDGGKTIEHPSKKFLNNRAKYAVLVQRAFACEGGKAAVLGRNEELDSELGPRAAALWVGSRWHWEVEQEDFTIKDRESGENVKVTSTSVVPTAFLGYGEGGGSVKASTSEAVAESGSSPLDEMSPETQTKIKVLAASHEYPAWVDKMMEIDEVMGNSGMISALADQGFYNGLKG